MQCRRVPGDLAALRAFNRFHTQLIGGTSRSYLGSGMTLPEARFLFEVATKPGSTAQEIRGRVAFDQGHLSRIASRLARRGLVQLRTDPQDGRRRRLHLTASGTRVFKSLDAKANAQARELLSGLQPAQRPQLLGHLAEARRLLGDPTLGKAAARIRRGRVGDLGWALGRQAALYKAEFGYHDLFETYVAQGVAAYLQDHDAKRDGLWVAELHGQPVGCVAIQHDRKSPGWAQLRWYFVEPHARGQGIGARLLAQAIRFAKGAGYKGIRLWTVDDLVAARRQYEKAGFRLAHQDPAPCPWAPWGHEQRWEMRFPLDPRRT